MMKSILICYCLILGSFFAFLSGVEWIHFDHAQNTIAMALKRSLMSTMVDYVDEMEFEAQDILQTFRQYFKEITLSDYEYDIALTGFMKEPLFMRIECQAIGKDGSRIHVEDMIIEELREYE